MSLSIKLAAENWDHNDDDHRIEVVSAISPDINEGLAKLALRFISEKGLSGEFADLIEEINVAGNSLFQPEEEIGHEL